LRLGHDSALIELAAPLGLMASKHRDSKGLRGNLKMLSQREGSASAVRAHEELFAYWASRREPGRLPSRSHINPCDFKRHLPTISLIDVLASPSEGLAHDYRLRLAGTGLYEVYRGEITGKRLDDFYDDASAKYWRTELDKVVEGRRPGVGSHSLAWRGAPHMSILWLRLPLASDGRHVDMVLGYDVIVGSQGEFARSGIRAA
jgi:hypothetical protein